MLGIGFGSVDYCVLTLIGATSCEASVWVSDAQLNCKTSSGTGQALNGKILGGSRANIYEAALSYAAATVSSASPALLPVTGSALVTLFGSGYGIASSSSSARFGHSIASHMVWKSDSSIVSKCVAGSLRSFAATVSSGSQQAHSNLTLSYSLSRPVCLNASNLPVSGGISITLVGSAFGFNDVSARLVIVPTSVSSTIWLSSSSVGSKVCSAIFRATEVRLSIDRQYGSALRHSMLLQFQMYQVHFPQPVDPSPLLYLDRLLRCSHVLKGQL